jgi:hypothetical protein
MTGLLRFIGVLNGAIWLGGAVFFTLVAGPAFFSDDMRRVLGDTNYPYYSGTIAQLVLKRYFLFLTVCGVIALLRLLIQRLYLGRCGKFAVGLVVGLLALTLVGGYWLAPKLSALHTTRYTTQTAPAEQETAARSFRVWHAVSQAVNLLLICGLGIHVWQAARPVETSHYIDSVKFRG